MSHILFTPQKGQIILATPDHAMLRLFVPLLVPNTRSRNTKDNPTPMYSTESLLSTD